MRRAVSATAELLVDTGTNTVTDLVNDKRMSVKFNVAIALLPSYVLFGAHI